MTESLPLAWLMFRTMSVRLKRAPSVFCLLSIIFRQLRPTFCLIWQQFPICHLSTQKLPKNRKLCQMRLKVDTKKVAKSSKSNHYCLNWIFYCQFQFDIFCCNFKNFLQILGIDLLDAVNLLRQFFLHFCWWSHFYYLPASFGLNFLIH